MTSSIPFIITLVLGSLSHSAFADKDSQLFVEKGLASRIYNETSHANHEHNPLSGSYFRPTVGSLAPSNLEVGNQYYATNYAQLSAIPFLQLGLESKLIQITPKWATLLGGSAIYGFSQGNIKTFSSDNFSVEDTVSIQTASIELLTRNQYTPLILNTIRLSGDIGFGQRWIHQQGTIDGFDQTQRLSYIVLGPSIDLSLDKAFGFSASIYREIGFEGRGYAAWRIGAGTWLEI